MHLDEQPSRSVRLPSSHSSPFSTLPFPHLSGVSAFGSTGSSNAMSGSRAISWCHGTGRSGAGREPGAGGGAGGSEGGTDVTPAKVGRAPSAVSGPWHSEVPHQVRLAKPANFEPLATNIISADLDGYGYQDFFAALL